MKSSRSLFRNSERQLEANPETHFRELTATIAGKVAVLESTARSCGVPVPLRASCYAEPDKYLAKLDAYLLFRTTILDREGYDFANNRNDIFRFISANLPCGAQLVPGD